MKFANITCLSTLALLLIASNVSAQTTPPTTTDGSPPTAADADQPGWLMSHYNAAEAKVEQLYDTGELSIVLSGEAHHGRGTYTTQQIDQFTEKVWGLGMSKELRDDKDNEEDISFVIMADSHYVPQITAGYGYQWMAHLGGNWEAGIGYTAGLISRSDIIGGTPFPGVLPLGSIGTRSNKLMVSYIPRLTSGKGNGDVLFLALRLDLK